MTLSDYVDIKVTITSCVPKDQLDYYLEDPADFVLNCFGIHFGSSDISIEVDDD